MSDATPSIASMPRTTVGRIGPAGIPQAATSPQALDAWTAGVVGDVVDRSIEAARINRERAQAERARRDAEEARRQAAEERDRRVREEIEAADARKLLEQRRAEARDAEEAAQREAAARARVQRALVPGALDLSA